MDLSDNIEAAMKVAAQQTPPIPEGQKCESERHIENMIEGWHAIYAVICKECKAEFDPRDEEELEYGDNCPQCGGEKTLEDEGCIWIEEEPLAEVPIYEIDKQNKQVCVTFFCEYCREDLGDLNEYISEEGGWPTQDGELVRPSRCSEL